MPPPKLGDERGRDELGRQVDDVDPGQVERREHEEYERPSVTETHTPEPIRHGERVLLVGNTGTGKSEAGLSLFANQRGQRLLIDVPDHYELGPDALAEDPPPLTVDRPREIDWRHRTIRYVPRRPGDRKEMDDLHQAIFERGNLLVVCDEAEDVAPSAGSGAPRWVKKVVKQGRKRRITYVAATQRPAGVDRSVINQAEHALIFPMVDPDDLDTLSYRVGIGSRGLGAALAELGDFEYLRHTIGGRTVVHMPALPADAIAFTRRHVINPPTTRR